MYFHMLIIQAHPTCYFSSAKPWAIIFIFPCLLGVGLYRVYWSLHQQRLYKNVNLDDWVAVRWPFCLAAKGFVSPQQFSHTISPTILHWMNSWGLADHLNKLHNKIRYINRIKNYIFDQHTGPLNLILFHLPSPP